MKTPRSLLFVPARQRMLSKIASFPSDVFIVDLEDSVLQSDKTAALEDACAYLQSSCILPRIYVRIEKELMHEQIIALKQFPIRGFMLPKADDVKIIDDCLKLIGNGFELVALIETPRGVINASAIAASGMVSAFAFGAEDYSASIGMENTYENLLFARQTILNAARSYSLLVYDTPSFEIENLERVAEDASISASLGFDGKMAIHPCQIQAINEAFLVNDPEVMRQIIDEYESSGCAVLRRGNRVYEKMHINHLKKMLAEC